MKATQDYTITSVKRALQILKLFDDQRPELTLSEVSELLEPDGPAPSVPFYR